MENFNYHRPATVADAVKAMKKAKDGKYLSGGHDADPDDEAGACVADRHHRPAGLKNAGVKVGAKSVIIRAGTTHAEVAGSKPTSRRPFPALPRLRAASAIRMCATRARSAGRSPTTTRRRTIRPPALGLGATIHTSEPQDPGGRSSSPACSRPPSKGAEMVTAVEFPIPKKSGYAKFPNPASLYAMVGVFVAQLADGSVRVAVTGAGPGVFRAPEHGSGACQELLGDGAGWHRGQGQGPEQRHACLGRIPRAFDHGHGEAGRGSGEVSFDARLLRNPRARSRGFFIS